MFKADDYVFHPDAQGMALEKRILYSKKMSMERVENARRDLAEKCANQQFDKLTATISDKSFRFEVDDPQLDNISEIDPKSFPTRFLGIGSSLVVMVNLTNASTGKAIGEVAIPLGPDFGVAVQKSLIEGIACRYQQYEEEDDEVSAAMRQLRLVHEAHFFQKHYLDQKMLFKQDVHDPTRFVCNKGLHFLFHSREMLEEVAGAIEPVERLLTDELNVAPSEEEGEEEDDIDKIVICTANGCTVEGHGIRHSMMLIDPDVLNSVTNDEDLKHVKTETHIPIMHPYVTETLETHFAPISIAIGDRIRELLKKPKLQVDVTASVGIKPPQLIHDKSGVYKTLIEVSTFEMIATMFFIPTFVAVARAFIQNIAKSVEEEHKRDPKSPTREKFLKFMENYKANGNVGMIGPDGSVSCVKLSEVSRST